MNDEIGKFIKGIEGWAREVKGQELIALAERLARQGVNVIDCTSGQVLALANEGLIVDEEYFLAAVNAGKVVMED